MNDEDTIFKKIKRLEDDLRGYKTSQPVGTDSVITYTTQTNNIWDVETTLPPNTLGFGNSSYEEYEIQFTSRNQIAPFARARVFAQCALPIYYVTSDVAFSTTAELTIAVSESTSYLNPTAASDPQLYRYTIRVSGPQLTAYKLKFIMDATDQGRMSIYKSTNLGLVVVIP